MNKLENARKEINRIDKEITKLFEERMKQVEDVIIYKMENNLQILDAGREKEVIERNCKILVNKELEKYYLDFIENMMRISKNYQKDILEKIISISSTMNDGATGIMLCKKIQERKLLPCNKSEIIGILETLAICGILETPEHKGYIDSFTPPLMRDTGNLKQSLSYPLNWWHGENKVNYDNCYKIFNIDFSYLSEK